MKRLKVDIPFLLSVIILIITGYLVFASASLGLLSKQPMKYANVAFNQTFLGLFMGCLALLFFSNFDYKIIRKYSVYFLVFSVICTLLVFAPKIGISHGGANRWIRLGGLSFQPTEFLKIGYIIFLSAFYAKFKDRVGTFNYGLLPYVILTFVSGLVLLIQPDTDTFLITLVSGIAIYLSAGGKWKHVAVLFLIGIISVTALAIQRPYIRNRINTFINPSENALGSGYQIQQSLIAIGSGGLFGRGFGQSIQKFNVLPEPIGDSIFAVASEEFGFLGSSFLILLFIFFTMRGLKIATKIPDTFGRLMVIGIVIMVVSQAFVNIGAMVGVLPLSGITLPFVSHGGTALFMTLAEMGIILNVSKNQKNS